MLRLAIPKFPPVSTADEDGLLAVGGNLEVPTLVHAYGQGIFPWPILPDEDVPLTWFAPPSRAVLFFKDFRIPRNLARAQKKNPFTYSFNRAFTDVILRCADAPNRKGHVGTWITEEMIEAYTQLHQAGHAHSVESWNGEELVGGVYGVCIGRCFSAESMFHSEDNASKLALLHLIEHLGSAGAEWLDAQVLNPFTESFGFKDIPREEFQRLLKVGIKQPPITF